MKTKGQKISEKQKLSWKNPEIREKRIKSLKENWKNNHEKHVEGLKNGWKKHYKKRCAIMKRVMNTPERKKRSSEIAKEIWSRPGYKEKMVPLLRKYYLKYLENHKNKINSRAGQVNKTGKSYIEKLMAKILDSANVKYYIQYPIVYKKGGAYVKFADFLLPNHKKIIECDGEKWHQNKVKDDERDKIILSILGNDWNIQHISGKEIYEFSKFFGFI